MMLPGPTPTLTAMAGIVLLGAGAIGYFVIQAKFHERVLFIAGAMCLIIPGVVTDPIGLALGAAAIGSQLFRRKAAAGAKGAAYA
jgi:TRAP-type uncharacterized transport system fused permease subunit